MITGTYRWREDGPAGTAVWEPRFKSRSITSSLTLGKLLYLLSLCEMGVIKTTAVYGFYEHFKYNNPWRVWATCQQALWGLYAHHLAPLGCSCFASALEDSSA